MPECLADIGNEETIMIAPILKAHIPLKLSSMHMSQTPVIQPENETKTPETHEQEIANEEQDEIEEETETEREYTDREKEMIAYVVYAEARGERFEGKVAVAQVVINRFESGRFGKSVKKVVYARSQFAVSKRYNKSCMDAVEHAIENRPHPENMYYFQVSKRKKWRNFVYYRRIGNHSFYCSKK